MPHVFFFELYHKQLSLIFSLSAASTIDQSSFDARIRLMNAVGRSNNPNILEFLGSYSDAGILPGVASCCFFSKAPFPAAG